MGNGEHTTLLSIAVGPDLRPRPPAPSTSRPPSKTMCFLAMGCSCPARSSTYYQNYGSLDTLSFLGTVAVSKRDMLRFSPLMRNFINCTPSSAVHDSASRSHLLSVWHPVDALSGGFELPSVATSVELLHVNLIQQLIRQSRQDYSTPPK